METVENTKKQIEGDLEIINLQKQICELEVMTLSIFQKMKIIELTTLGHDPEMAKIYPQEYRAYCQAVKDMQGYIFNVNVADMKMNLQLMQKTLAMHQETLKTYETFRKRYQELYKKSTPEEVYDREKIFQKRMKEELIDEVLTLIYPNLTTELKPVMRKRYEEKTVEELEDIKRVFEAELSEDKSR